MLPFPLSCDLMQHTVHISIPAKVCRDVGKQQVQEAQSNIPQGPTFCTNNPYTFVEARVARETPKHLKQLWPLASVYKTTMNPYAVYSLFSVECETCLITQYVGRQGKRSKLHKCSQRMSLWKPLYCATFCNYNSHHTNCTESVYSWKYYWTLHCMTELQQNRGNSTLQGHSKYK